MNLPIRLPSGDWTAFAPNGEPQRSGINETNACCPFSGIHVLEPQYQFLTGQKIDWSECGLTVMSGTSPENGNSAEVVSETIQQLGLLTTQDWPEPQVFTVPQFYTPIPAATRSRGNIFLRQWEVVFFEITEAQVSTYLKSCPIWIRMKLPDTYHLVALLNTTTYFDSYEQYLKQLNYPIANYYVLFLIPKAMTNSKLISVQGTLGYWNPATTPDGLKSQALNVGEVLPTNSDGSVDFSKVVPDYTI